MWIVVAGDAGVCNPDSLEASVSDVKTCLVGVRLASALRLVVSVISMVCGSRPVCVYWATSGLWL
jgi:hypothetical protein